MCTGAPHRPSSSDRQTSAGLGPDSTSSQGMACLSCKTSSSLGPSGWCSLPSTQQVGTCLAAAQLMACIHPRPRLESPLTGCAPAVFGAAYGLLPSAATAGCESVLRFLEHYLDSVLAPRLLPQNAGAAWRTEYLSLLACVCTVFCAWASVRGAASKPCAADGPAGIASHTSAKRAWGSGAPGHMQVRCDLLQAAYARRCRMQTVL